MSSGPALRASCVDASGVVLPGLVPGADGTVPAVELLRVLHQRRPGEVADDAELLERMAAAEVLLAHLRAVQADDIAELTRRRVVVDDEGVVRQSVRTAAGERGREWAADEIAPRLRIGLGAADHRIDVALALASRLPATRSALRLGRVDHPRAAVMVEQTEVLGAAQAAAVEQRVLARGPRTNPSVWKRAVARAVAAADPDAAQRRCTKQRAARRVRIWSAGDGTGTLQALLPVEVAAAVFAALQATATAWKQLPGEDRTMDQLRADALALPFLLALDTGVLRALALPESATLARYRGLLPAVHLHVHTDTLQGSDQRAGEVRGLGPVPAALARRLATAAVRRDEVGSGWDRPPEKQYRPSDSLAAHIHARNPGCVHPSCTRTHGLQLDHTVPYPAGPTSAANLGPLSQRHHLFKQSPGVRLEQPAPGHYRWTMPTGHEYDVDPPEWD